MRIVNEVFNLLKYDFKEELSSKIGINSILVYIVSICYFIYFLIHINGSTVELEVKYWNILYWLIIFFSVINFSFNNLNKNSNNRFSYLYITVSPIAFILSKIIFNILTSFLISIFTLFFFIIWLGNPIYNITNYLIVTLLGSTSFSLIFTMMGTISIQTIKSPLMSTILSFPLSLPIIIFLSKLLRETFFEESSSNFLNNLISLFSFDIIIIILVLILFPYLWEE